MDLHGKHLLGGLAKRGHKVIVISTKHPSLKEYEEINGIKIHYLKDTDFGSSRKGWKRESRKKFLEIIRTENIDIAVSQSRAGYSIARLSKNMKMPLVTIFHGYETMVFFSILRQVLNFKTGIRQLIRSFFATAYYTFFQEYPLLFYSDRIIAVSKKVSNVMSGRFPNISPKIKMIDIGIDIKIFNFSEETRSRGREMLGIPAEEKVILFLSLISKQKGADVAIKAFREISHDNTLRLVIGGDGEYLEGAKELVREYNLESKVIFPGFIPNEEAALYYNAADVFIFPTLRLESFGIVIAEAMACKKPVIASRIGSIPYVIDDGIDGVLIEPGDYRGLAEQIDKILHDNIYSERLAQNAYLKARSRFDMEKMIKETMQIFEDTRNR
jgi:glycosyltransferase involved in cell wall biosynthesis